MVFPSQKWFSHLKNLVTFSWQTHTHFTIIYRSSSSPSLYVQGGICGHFPHRSGCSWTRSFATVSGILEHHSPLHGGCFQKKESSGKSSTMIPTLIPKFQFNLTPRKTKHISHWTSMHRGLKFNIFSFSKGASLMPLMENPSTPDWKSAVFWQVGYVVCNLVTLCVTWKTTLSVTLQHRVNVTFYIVWFVTLCDIIVHNRGDQITWSQWWYRQCQEM